VPRDPAKEPAATVAAEPPPDPALADTLGAKQPALDDTILAGHAGGSEEIPPLPIVDAHRYRLGSEVGRGGLGRVLSAHDAVFGRTVAIKELTDDGQESRRRFRREVLLTARLQHPGIVPIYDAARWADDAPFYAMKLVGGRPLSDAIDAARNLKERLALLPNVLAVADAIAYAHDEKVIHRDLKPHNVLVGTHGETIVIDWGLAKDLADSAPESSGRPSTEGALHETQVGATLGTPAYMAPEQAAGGKVDERTDVYALGGMLYHVLSGMAPHDGRTLAEMLGRIERGEIVPLETREPRAPRELTAIVAKAMALRPADRYPTAREVADDLRRYTTDQMVGAYRYSLLHRMRRWVERHAAVSVAVTLLTLFGAWGFLGLRRERQTAFDAARLGLELAAASTSRDVAFSLDQADPMLASLRTLADPSLPLRVVAPRMHDLALARPGISNVSLGFPSGLFRGTFVPEGQSEIEVQESEVGDGRTQRKNYRVEASGLSLVGELDTDYDVRHRPHYTLAEQTHARTWMPPRLYFTSGRTGITCTEPVYDAAGALVAVATVDFDVGALSAFVAHPPIAGSRAVVFAADGSVLAFPSASQPQAAVKEGRLLRHEDFKDPVLEALFAERGAKGPALPRFFELRANGEGYLVAVAPMTGKRAGVSVPLEWYVATMAPTRALMGTALDQERRAGVALGVAFVAVMVMLIVSAYRARSGASASSWS
jgi:hypothetical protein